MGENIRSRIKGSYPGILRIFVGGIQGVGKTTLLKGLAISHENRFQYATLSHDLLKKLGCQRRRELISIPLSIKVKSIEECLLPLVNQFKQLIVDFHYLFDNSGTLQSGLLTPESVKSFNYLVHIIAVPNLICDRRHSDSSRTRDTDMARIAETQVASILEATRLSQESGVPLLILPNNHSIETTISCFESLFIKSEDYNVGGCK